MYRHRSAGTLLVAVLVAASLVSGCSDLNGTDGKQYVTGDGQIVMIPPAERGDPIEAAGTSVDGDPLDLADYRGRVVISNVWWSQCPPCRKEMPILVEVAADVDPQDVALVGINIRDLGTANAQAFQRATGVEYPSFYDPGAEVLLAFSEDLSPRSIPSTAILDRQGRLAALVLGEIPGRVTLTDLVEQVEAEPGTDDG